MRSGLPSAVLDVAFLARQASSILLRLRLFQFLFRFLNLLDAQPWDQYFRYLAPR